MSASACTSRAALRSTATRASSTGRTPAAAKPAAALSARTCIAPITLRARRSTTGSVSRAALRVNSAIASETKAPASYQLPAWADFEFGTSPVLWEPKQPKAGETMTVWYNPELTGLQNGDYVAFNGGFNGPFMCGGAPRGMAFKTRGDGNVPLYSIRINVPKHARYLEFGFTDGFNWDEGYKVSVALAKGFQGKDDQFFTKGLEVEMGYEGACEAAIFPDTVPEATMCKMPGGGSGLAGQSCDLDIQFGCMDPEAPNYNPMATAEDDSCELAPPGKTVK